jgi:hypothetical protein
MKQETILCAHSTFLAYILFKNPEGKNIKIQVCLPINDYKISRKLKSYFEINFPIYYTPIGSKNPIELMPRIKRSDIDYIHGSNTPAGDLWFPNEYYLGESTNQKKGISLIDYNPLDFNVDMEVITNEMLAFFMGLERIELESEFKSVGTIYWWEDKETSNTVWDGIDGIQYNGEAPPYDVDSRWIMSVVDKIHSLRTKSGKRPCIISSGTTSGVRIYTLPEKLYSISECKLIFQKDTLNKSLYYAVASFVKKYPTPEQYENQ